MSTRRLNIEFPSDDYTFLKVLCAEKGVSIKDFVVPLVLRALEEEEDAFLARKARQRLKDMNPADLIPIEEAFTGAGWNLKEIQNSKGSRKRRHSASKKNST
jgi:hypothetical protein